MANVKIDGVEAIVAATRRFEQQANDAVRRGLRIWGEETMTISKEQYVPVRFSILKNTGNVELVDGEEGPEVILSYGGESPADEYAVYVHEIPANHEVGGDKYLERPAMRESSKLNDVVAGEVKRSTGV